VDELQARLMKCFRAVFPTLSDDEIAHARPDTVPGWDSVAGVTLFAAIEEEIGIEIDVQDLVDLCSFEEILAYLRRKNSGADGAAFNSTRASELE
jgi:acyl carrier protein